MEPVPVPLCLIEGYHGPGTPGKQDNVLQGSLPRKPSDADMNASLESYELGRDLISKARLQEALIEFRRALSIDPDFLDARFELAGAARLLGRYEEALEHYAACLAIRADDVEAILSAADTALLAGEIVRAVGWYREILSIDPKQEDAAARLAAAEFFGRGPRRAWKTIRRALSRNPDWVMGYVYLGNLAELLRKNGPAEAAYQEALKRVADHRAAHAHLDRLRRGEPYPGDPFDEIYNEVFLGEAGRAVRVLPRVRALALLGKWRERFPRHPRYLELVLQIRFAAGDFSRAMQEIDAFPEEYADPGVRLIQARILREWGSTDAAEEAFRSVCDSEPTMETAWLERAHHLSSEGRLEEAERVLRKGVEELPLSTEILFELARTAKKKGSGPSCVSTLERILQLDPGHERALLALGHERLELEDLRSALECFEKLLTATPRDPETHRRVAVVETRLENWTEAKAAWENVLRFRPGDAQAALNLRRIDRLVESGPLRPAGRGKSGA